MTFLAIIVLIALIPFLIHFGWGRGSQIEQAPTRLGQEMGLHDAFDALGFTDIERREFWRLCGGERRRAQLWRWDFDDNLDLKEYPT